LYQIIVSKKARKFLYKIPKKDARAILKKINALSIEPKPSGVKKLLGSDSEWRIRVGDYRAIYQVMDDVIEIHVLKIGHRKDVYQ
jgi:mRNA interferase RelE/StbE